MANIPKMRISFLLMIFAIILVKVNGQMPKKLLKINICVVDLKNDALNKKNQSSSDTLDRYKEEARKLKLTKNGDE